jgi:hypothetical protein
MSMPQSRRTWLTLLAVIAMLALAIDYVAAVLLRNPALSHPSRVAVALLPIPGDVALIVLVLIGIRRLDDFQKRVHFEAVTIAFLCTGVAVFVHGYLEKAQAVGALSAGLVWAFMLVFYAIGYFVAAGHYK